MSKESLAKSKLSCTNYICSSLYGFKLERLPLAINAADENRHSTGTLEDAIPRYSSASWHKMGMLLHDAWLDPVVDRVESNDRLGCFVDRLDWLYRLVADFTTRLDLADFRSTWSTCGHVDQSFLLVLAYCIATDAKKFCVQSPDAFPVPNGRPSFPFLFPPLIFS